MNAIGKDVDNRSGFFWGENPVFFLTLVLYQADSPFGGAVFFVFLQAQCPEIWHSFRFGSRFGLQTLWLTLHGLCPAAYQCGSPAVASRSC